MAQLNILPSAGSVLLYGKLSQFQSNVAFELAMQVAERGGTVVFLGDSHNSAAVLSEHTIAWRSARHLPIGQRLHVISVDERSLFQKPARDYIDRIRGEAATPALVVRDIAMDTAAFDVGDPWFSIADWIAAALGCAVLTVAHSGPSPAPLDIGHIVANEIWKCTAGNGLAVTLTRERPSGGQSIKLLGRDATNLIVFDAVANEVVA